MSMLLPLWISLHMPDGSAFHSDFSAGGFGVWHTAMVGSSLLIALFMAHQFLRS